MLTLAGTPGSDDWYLLELANEMGRNFPRLAKLRRYRIGDAPVPEEASGAMREAYRAFVKKSRLNMCDLIVGAKSNRQKVLAFRTAAAGDELGDETAWAHWRRSHMGIGSRQLFGDAGHYGDAFITVNGSTTRGSDLRLEEPVMVPSDAWSTWTRQHSRFSWVTEYAIEVGHDPIAQVDRIILFGMGWFRIAERPAAKTTIPNTGEVWKIGADWTWTGERQPMGWTQKNPVVRYSTMTRMGVYEAHLDTVDRINDGIKQRSTIQAMQAFRQRAIKGDMPSHYPEDHERAGQKIDYNEIFKAGPAALWLLPDDADIWESSVTDIQPLLNANKDDKKDLATVTSTPLYTLQPDAAAGSATGAEVMRETLVFSVEELNELAADALATAQSLMFEASGDTSRSDPALIDVTFASVERASIIERTTAAAAAKAAGQTQRYIDAKIMGLTPAEQRQAILDREDEALMQLTAG